MSALRFTASARRVMHLANKEAHRLNHEYIGTEHMLLGVIAEKPGVAAAALHELGLDAAAIRARVVDIAKMGPELVTIGPLPQTPRAKQVVRYAIEEAQAAADGAVGTGHLLIGLARERDGIAAEILYELGATLERVRQAVSAGHVADGASDGPGEFGPGPDPGSRARGWLRRLLGLG